MTKKILQGNLKLYRIKQDYVNYNSCSACFRKESLHLYHYAGNNPVRYIDPDGRYLHIYIDKSMGILYYEYTTADNQNYTILFDYMDIITNVNIDFPDNNAESDPNRYQDNNTNPTQIKNGTYKITMARAPSEKVNPDGKYGTGDQGLVIGVVQQLPIARGEEKGKLVDDSGYMIHITPYFYTNGCLGIYYDENNKNSKAFAEAKIEILVDMYYKTISENGDKDATLTVF